MSLFRCTALVNNHGKQLISSLRYRTLTHSFLKHNSITHASSLTIRAPPIVPRVPQVPHVSPRVGGYIEWRISARSFSASTVSHKKDTDHQPAKGNLQPPVKSASESELRFKLRRVKFLCATFLYGFKNLWGDIKLMHVSRKKMRKGAILSREEHRHMHQTMRDLMKTLPIVIVFWFPGMGYFVPVIAFMYPKQLLSHQFWTEEQKKKFRVEDHIKRSTHYRTVVQHLNKTEELLPLLVYLDRGEHPINADLIRFQKLFSDSGEKLGKLSLQMLPKDHLLTLHKCWSLRSPTFMPKWWLAGRLENHLMHLHQDDLLLAKEGVEGLSESLVSLACYDRGLDDSALTPEALAKWLREWVAMSSKVSSNEMNASFIAHSAIFKSLNAHNRVK